MLITLLRPLMGLVAAVALLTVTTSAQANTIYIDFDKVTIHDKLDGDLTTCGDFVSFWHQVAWAPAGEPFGDWESGDRNLLVPKATLDDDGERSYWRQCDNTSYELLNTHPDPAALFAGGTGISHDLLADLTYYVNGGSSRLVLGGQPSQQLDLYVGGWEDDPYTAPWNEQFGGVRSIKAPPAGGTRTFAQTVARSGNPWDALQLTVSGTIKTSSN